MADLTISKDDYGFDINFTVVESDGTTARSLSGKTVTFKAWDKRAPFTSVASGACTVDVAASGTCHYTVQDGDFDTVGNFTYELELTSSGVVESSKQYDLEVVYSG